MSSNVRETLSSRLGFLLLSAGCAIGMGNVWRFPYVTGAYGGGWFVVIYLFFLVVLGWPIMQVELAIGRAGRANLVGSLRKLSATPSRGKAWSTLGRVFFSGNMVLLMFYTVVTGWLLNYTWKYSTGVFAGVQPEQVEPIFGEMMSSVPQLLIAAFAGIALCMVVCSFQLTKGLERVTKYMMLCLFGLMICLVVESLNLPGSGKGVEFFLKPNWDNMMENGLFNVIQAAMMQAFFTLSLGIGSIGIFGSYMDGTRSLMRESAIIIVLDTFVAICAGLIIFPACASFGVSPNSGPSLIMITLPKIFQAAPTPWVGQVQGIIFFVFLSFAALSTLFAVFENMVAFCLDEYGWSRPKASLVCGVALALLSVPCALGFNVLSHWTPLGDGSCILDLEDFIVSSNLLPLGALMQLLFCTTSWGWGMANLKKELSIGSGIQVPKIVCLYLKYILPCIILLIWLVGIWQVFK